MLLATLKDAGFVTIFKMKFKFRLANVPLCRSPWRIRVNAKEQPVLKFPGIITFIHGQVPVSGAPNEKILLQVSECQFYIISVLFVRFKGLFLNAKKNVSVRIR